MKRSRTAASTGGPPVKARPRVLVVEEHRIFAAGLARLLEPRCDVVGIVATTADVVSAAIEQQPDIAIMDVSMSVGTGMSVIQEIAARSPSVKVIALTVHQDMHLAAEAQSAGASGCLLADATPDELFGAIATVFGGGRHFPSLAGERASASRRAEDGLTPRQRAVLRLLAEGHRVKDIAVTLNLSPRTVETHKYEMMETLGIESTVDLVRYAIRQGLV